MDNQDYVDIAYENLEGILHLYNEHKDKHPVMLFDVQERRVYAYLSLPKNPSPFLFSHLRTSRVNG